MDRWLNILLALALTTSLTACGGPAARDDDNDGSSSQGDDDDDSGPEYYGPENSWWHALAQDVPSDLAGTGFRTGDVAHNFTAIDQFGDTVELYQFYGQVIVLDVFAQWCGPCQENAPHGRALWEDYGDQGVIMLAAMQENSAGAAPAPTNATQWADEFSLTHPVVADEQQFNIDYIVTGFPTYIVIDQQMNVVNDDLWPFDPDYVAGILNQ